MKITAVDTCVLTVPTRRQMALQFPHHKLVVAQISTDEGAKGMGYSMVFNGGGAEAVHTYLETRLKPALLGEDPLYVERLWEKMFRVDMGIKKQGVAAYALSAADIALWDLTARVAKLPLHKLWGAHSDQVACYGSGGWGKYAEKDLIAEAERYASQGVKYYKMKIHDPDPKVNARRVEAVLKALGGKVRMMVDVNQRLDVLGNVRQAALLEDLDLVWYEEPVLADDLSALQQVAERISIPIATGENNFTRWEFRDLIERKAATFLMPDVCRANGYSETMRIGRLAAAHQLSVAPHVAHEISLPVVGALPNGFLVEYMDWHPDDLFEETPACKDGQFRIPDRPGHGIAITAAAMKKYRSA
jgi:L-alanine-DL-glutamate epimerase-like enolase superfamily enzyme